LVSPLHIAARTKEGEKCAEMLLKSGADVNATREVNHRNFINGWHTFLECSRSWVQKLHYAEHGGVKNCLTNVC
jgi:hypothetical protein